MSQINWYLWMRVQLIVGPLIEDEHGLFEGQKHRERHSLCVVEGMSSNYSRSIAGANIFYRFSVLPAISLTDGILHCDIVEGSFRADTFRIFIERLLDYMEPYPSPNSVIVMDNCKIHKQPELQELIQER
jgi:hypothetical protein